MKKNPTILVYHPKDAEAYKAAISKQWDGSIHSASTAEEVERYLPETEIILGWKFPTGLLSKPAASSVRWFQSTGAGVNDLVAEKSIPQTVELTRIVGQFGSPIAEYVFAYLLFLEKEIARMRESQNQHRWDSFIPGMLEGKTIGVAGLGSIGAEIVRKARAFDMKVYGLSVSGKQSALVDRHFSAFEWPEFAAELDYLILTLPLTEATQYIVKRNILTKMKPDACLVNVGRGALIHENDLVAVMKNGHLKAAVLDVFETEPLPKDHPLYSIPNVYITPHLSGPSTIAGVSQFFIENLKRYLGGQPLQGIVDRTRGY